MKAFWDTAMCRSKPCLLVRSFSWKERHEMRHANRAGNTWDVFKQIVLQTIVDLKAALAPWVLLPSSPIRSMSQSTSAVSHGGEQEGDPGLVCAGPKSSTVVSDPRNDVQCVWATAVPNDSAERVTPSQVEPCCGEGRASHTKPACLSSGSWWFVTCGELSFAQVSTTLADCAGQGRGRALSLASRAFERRGQGHP